MSRSSNSFDDNTSIYSNVADDQSSMSEVGSHCLPSPLINDAESSINSSAYNPEIDQQISVKIVHTHSNYRLNPHELGYYHDEPPLETIKQLFEAYEQGSIRLDRDQFVHHVPNTIRICGHNLWLQLKRGGSFGVPLFDAIMRVYKRLDDIMYERGLNSWSQRLDDLKLEEAHGRWRHFLPASFAAKVINGENYLQDANVRSAFIGQHISYNVEDCNMLVAPILLDGRWSCYFWDFPSSKIHVLDPTMMRSSITRVQSRHDAYVTRLHHAISRCKDTFFHGWSVEMNGWTRCYVVGLGVSCMSHNSGLFAANYVRSFDDIHLLWALQTGDHGLNRAELLYQLLWTGGNVGAIPHLLIDLMEV